MVKAVFELALLCLNIIRCQSRILEPFMVGANYSKIEDFPHSANIKSYCGGNHTRVCGSSILNQQILLTAAHCLVASDCTERMRISASIGDENKRTGMRIEASNYKIHEKYLQTELAFDIALVLLETPIALNSKVSRVSITKVPVRDGQVACIAGWGFTNASSNRKVVLLKHVFQKIITHNICRKIIEDLPEGVFCAGEIGSESYPARGDSGSALMVNSFTQAGLVAYSMPNIPSIVVYTDLAYHYNWLRENALKLYCNLRTLTTEMNSNKM